MFREITERQWRTLWPYLSVVDTLLAVIVIPNFVASYWMGTWLMFDFYLYPEDEVKSTWLSYGVGNFAILCFIAAQQFLKRLLIPSDQKRSVKFTVISKVYTYMLSILGVLQWRGLAYVAFLYTGMSLVSAVIGLVVAAGLLSSLRIHLGIITPPLTMGTDPDINDYFTIATKFSCQPQLNLKFVLDTFFTVFIVSTLYGFALKGYWIILETVMPVNENDSLDTFHMGLISLAIFYGLLPVPIIGQYELIKWCKKATKKSTLLSVVAEEMFVAVFAMLPMIFWRAIYLLHMSFVPPEYYELYIWISHSVGFVGVSIMFVSTSMIPIGCADDVTAFQSEYGVFDYRYFRKFLDKRRTIKQQEREDNLDFGGL